MSLAEFGVGFECHFASVIHAAMNFVVRLLDSPEIILSSVICSEEMILCFMQ